MPKLRYTLNAGVSWTVVDAPLPFNIPATAAQDVVVEPIGAAVSNLGTVNGNFLNLSYDAAVPTADVAAFTNTAGTYYWVFTNSLTPPAGGGDAIIAGTGFLNAGNVGTVPGALAIMLPARSGANDVFMHAIVEGAGGIRTNIATVRVYIGTASAWATLGNFVGNWTTYNYTDAEGTWRAHELIGNGSYDVLAPGGTDNELVGGGGGGGGGGATGFHGGGGAGGHLRFSEVLAVGTYNIVVGEGGAGGSTANSGRSTNGGNSTALGRTAVGGGGGGNGNGTTLAQPGGSGGGGGGNNVNGAAGTSGQGFAGGNAAAGNGGAGGGGAGGAGQNVTVNGVAGNGGAGITSTITGTPRGIAGGGGGGGSGTSAGIGTQGGGSAPTSSPNPGGNATAPGGGGGAARGTGSGGNGFRGHYVVRVKIA